MKKEKHQSCQLGLISIEIKLISCSFLFSLVLYLVFYMQEGIYWHKTNNHSTHSQLCPVSQFSVNRMLQNFASFFYFVSNSRGWVCCGSSRFFPCVCHGSLHVATDWTHVRSEKSTVRYHPTKPEGGTCVGVERCGRGSHIMRHLFKKNIRTFLMGHILACQAPGQTFSTTPPPFSFESRRCRAQKTCPAFLSSTKDMSH